MLCVMLIGNWYCVEGSGSWWNGTENGLSNNGDNGPPRNRFWLTIGNHVGDDDEETPNLFLSSLTNFSTFFSFDQLQNVIRFDEYRVGKVSKLNIRKLKSCVQSISNGGTRTLSKSKRWLLNCMDKDTDKYKDKDKSASYRTTFWTCFWSSSEVLESRWPQKTSHLPKSLIAVHKDQMSLASYEEKTKTDLEKYHFCSIENICTQCFNFDHWNLVAWIYFPDDKPSSSLAVHIYI